MTTPEFENKSLSLIEERKEIITEIERAIFTSRYNLSEKHFKIFSTNSIAILYSIWEGYVQNLFGTYVDYLNAQKIHFFSLNSAIIIYCKEREFRQLKAYPEKPQRKITLIRKMANFYSKDIQKIPRVVNTDSNVGFEILNRLLGQFGLEQYPEYWKIYTHPNPNLKQSLALFLKLRNTVSHGGELLPNERIDQEEYNRFKKLVTDLMYDLRDKMLAGIESETYLNSNS